MAERDLSDYIDVAERIADFRKEYPEGSLRPWDPAQPWRLVQAEGFEKNGELTHQTFIVVVAAAYRHGLDDNPGVGMAWEIFPGRTPYTRGSELQNAETSAWGRAIIAVGASDSKRGIASREEVRNRQAEREGTITYELCHNCGHAKDLHKGAPGVVGCMWGGEDATCDCGLVWNKNGSLSRSRTTDEQKAAAGVMTSAQQAAHTQLAKPPPNRGRTERVDAPVDDVWMDGPAGLAPQDDPEDRPGTATADQIKDIQTLYSAEFKIADRQKRVETTRKFLGIDMLSSHTQLSYRQAGDLLLAMRTKLKAAK